MRGDDTGLVASNDGESGKMFHLEPVFLFLILILILIIIIICGGRKEIRLLDIPSRVDWEGSEIKPFQG